MQTKEPDIAERLENAVTTWFREMSDDEVCQLFEDAAKAIRELRKEPAR